MVKAEPKSRARSNIRQFVGERVYTFQGTGAPPSMQ